MVTETPAAPRRAVPALWDLAALDTAHAIDDMDSPGFALRPLKGEMHGRWTISVNENWRLTFEFQDASAYVLDDEDYLMAMYNPPHPGEFTTNIYLEPHGISGRELAAKLDVAAFTLSRISKGSSRVTPEMALRLSKAIGRTPESWLLLQNKHDLRVARRHVDLKRVAKLRWVAA